MNSRKGNAFTIEAILGALLFILFISSIAIYANQFRENNWVAPDEMIANDVLTVMGKQGTLSTLNNTLIEDELNLIFANSSNYRMDLAAYNYSYGGFSEAGNSSIGQSIPENKEIVVAERKFFSTHNGSISNYTIARLYLWK